MAAKLPQFQPLPPTDTQVPPVNQSATPQSAQYSKPTSRSSHVNPQIDPHADQQLNYDPHLRRQWSGEPGVVHTTREHTLTPPVISDELKKLHDESVKRYPELNLSPGEHVVKEVYRHPIGLFIPIIGSLGVVILLLSVLFIYPFVLESTYSDYLPSFFTLLSFILPVIAIVLVFAYIAVWVYLRNRFFITNESVIQEIQLSLFSKHEQTASLGSIEDVSYFQNGIIPTMLNYGHIRMSTEGQESTYRFKYVNNPRKQIAVLTNAVEDFKNGRPVVDHHDN